MSESGREERSASREALLARLKRGAGAVATPDRPIALGRSEAPLACAQERLWVLQRLQPGTGFNGPIAAEIVGPLEVNLIDEALNAIVERHAILRSSFVEKGGVPVQQVQPYSRFSAEVADVRRLAPSEARREALRLGRQFVGRPFSFAGGEALLRALLVQVEAGRTVVVAVAPMLVFDAASCRVVMRELHDLYEAGVEGRPAKLPEIPFQFGDYAAWEQRRVKEGAYEASSAYWRAQLAGAPPLLELPLKRARPASQTFEARRLPIPLTAELVARVERTARAIRGTPFMVLLGALYALLYRYSAAEDIVVGSWVLRRGADTADLVGPFVNTVCLRADLSGNPTIEELLARVRRVALGAYAHQSAPFERVLSSLRVARDLSHNPLFQVNCVYQDASAGFPSTRMSLSALDARIGSAVGYDLEVVFRRAEGGLTGFIEYKAELFSRETIDAMAEEYARVIELVVSAPGLHLTELARRRAQAEVPAAYPAPASRGVVGALEGLGRATPDALAAVARDGQVWSLGRLLARSLQVTEALREHGLGPGVAVGVLMDDAVTRMAALLGIWRLGGVAVPAEPGDPGSVVEDRFATAETRAVLIEAEQPAPRFAELDAVLIRVPEGEPPPESVEAAGGALCEDAAGYVQFTSGTSGTPLGVWVSLPALALQARSIADRYELRPVDRVLRFARVDSDVYFEEVVPTLLSGATVVVGDLATPPSAAALRSEVETRSVTVLNLPTAYWEEVTRDLDSWEGRVPSCLRLVVVGGEQPSLDSFARFRRCAPNVSLMNAYGSTETTITTTTFCIPPGPSVGETDPIPAGGPIDGVRVQVLDREGGELPAGAIGRIHIGGEALAVGYLRQAGLTADRFTPDPLGRPGARLFRTDDVGRRLPDGSVQLLGRAGAPKLRGYRIDPVHVASTIQGLVQCECHVRVTQQRLVAYLGSLRAPMEPEQIRARLAQLLPRHLVPSQIVVLECLPRSRRGAVLPSALPALSTPRTGRPRPPEGPTQTLLAGVWQEALGLREIGRDDDFFTLGGDSLSAIKIAVLAREAGLRFEPAEILRYPTLAELASRIEAAREEIASASLEAPCSPS